MTDPKPTAESTKGPGSRAIGGGIWTMLERIISQACQVVVFVVAARVLGPADFGAFALVAACAILLMRVAEGGWSPYILAWPGDSTVPRQVLLIAILSGLVASVLGTLASGVLPILGVSAQTTTLMMLFAGWVTLAVTSSTQKAILIWMGRLRAASGAEILGELAGLSVALLALYSDQGVLSLVYGRLAFQSVQLTASFAITRLAPLPGMPAQAFRDMLRMSGQFFAARMIFNLRIYAATFMVGAFLGPASVGFYRAAERLTGAIAEVVGVPTQTLGWNLFREARAAHGGTTDGFQSVANVFFPVLLGVSIPLFAWLAVMGGDVISSLLGPEWLPMLPVLQVLALARLLTPISYINEPILSLAGRVNLLPRVAILLLALTLICVLSFAPMGLTPLAWSEVFIAIVSAAITIWCARRYGNIRWRGIALRSTRLVAAVSVGVLVLYVLRDSTFLSGWQPLLRALVLSIPALAVYLLALLALEPGFRKAIMGWIARRTGAHEGARD